MKVHHLERAIGVHPRMLVLLSAWQQRGPFEIVVAMHGGLRTDERVQKMLSGGGMSAAGSLRKTPHGRGGALDLWPRTFLPYVPSSWGGTAKRWGTWPQLPALVKAQFAEIVAFSKGLGFRCGADWISHDYPNGDNPHHELPDWGRLPFPPPEYEWPSDLAAVCASS